MNTKQTIGLLEAVKMIVDAVPNKTAALEAIQAIQDSMGARQSDSRQKDTAGADDTDGNKMK